MRKTIAFPTPLLFLAFFVFCLIPQRTLAQEAAQEPETAAPHDDGLADGDDPGPCGLEMPAVVRLADVHQGRLLLKTDHAGVYVPAPILDTEVAIRVTGLVARATVTQRFCNPAHLWVEGVYAFPLPENAAVDTLIMTIGDRVIEGQIHEREEARQAYEEAKAEGRTASLLEQERPNLFTTSLANLGPGEVAEVRIEYQQELHFDGGRFWLRFPMVAEERYTPDGSAGVPDPPRSADPINPVHLTVDLATGFPLARLESPSHAIRRGEAEPLHYTVDLGSEGVPADRDFVLEWTPAAGATPAASLFTQEIDGDTYALLMLMPPAETAGARFDLPRETVYIIDTSGSMAGASLREAKAALDLALARLQPRDSFNVIEFNSVTRRLFDASVPATADNVKEARQFVASLEADGGTEMLPALQAALDGPDAVRKGLRQVIFITDGAVGNEAELFAFIHAHLGDSRLFTVGIGSAPNSYFMTQAAEFGRGTFTYIGSAEEVAAKMGILFTKLDRPALTDLQVAWSDPGAETYPPRIPDLYHGEPVVVVARLVSAPAGEVTLSGLTHGTPWEVHAKALKTLPQSGLDKLWARRKIAELGTQLALGGDIDRIRPAIVDLGLAHHLVTDFTSLVAVDTTPRAPAGTQPRTLLIPVNMPAGWENGFEEGVLPQGDTSAPLNLAIGLLLLTTALALRRWSRPRTLAQEARS